MDKSRFDKVVYDVVVAEGKTSIVSKQSKMSGRKELSATHQISKIRDEPIFCTQIVLRDITFPGYL